MLALQSPQVCGPHGSHILMGEIENKQVNQNNITSSDTGHGKHKA